MTSDLELLRTAPGRASAVGELYERHARAVFGYLARRVDRAAAEDLLADVFVAALTARHRVWPHRTGSALPWLYGIAGNVVRSHLRGAARRPTRSLPADPAEPALTEAVDWDAVDARLDAAAHAGALRSALATLTGAERELLLLVAWEQLTPAEAAAALGLTPVAARSRLHRARLRAQSALDAAGAGAGAGVAAVATPPPAPALTATPERRVR
jgi:RNA polymerase sigma factor (sigma-70 family)